MFEADVFQRPRLTTSHPQDLLRGVNCRVASVTTLQISFGFSTKESSTSDFERYLSLATCNIDMVMPIQHFLLSKESNRLVYLLSY